MNRRSHNLYVASLVLVSFMGCRGSERENRSENVSSGRAADAAQLGPPDPAEATMALEAVHADLSRLSSGHIAIVRLRTDVANEQLLSLIAQLRHLIVLEITDSELTVPMCRQISKMNHLQILSLYNCRLGNEGLLAAVSGLSELQRLHLTGKTGATVDDIGMAALQNCRRLKGLSADFLPIGAPGIAELSVLKDLSELSLVGTRVDDAALAQIAKLPGIKILRIAKTGITREGLEKLAALPLEELDISECKNVDDEALEAVGKIASLKNLYLRHNPIGDAGVAHLANLKNLQRLSAEDARLTDAGLNPFLGMSKLEILSLGGTAVTEAGIRPLREANPRVKIYLTSGAIR